MGEPRKLHSMKQHRFLLFLPAILLVSACQSGDVRETLGISAAAPDEFVVVSRPPLSVPPEFDLKPPVPGAPETRAIPADIQAKQAVFGSSRTEQNPETAVDSIEAENLPSSGEATFFSKLKLDEADPAIRSKLGEDAITQRDTSEAKTLLEQLQIEDDDQPVVDPKREAARLRDNKDNDRPLNEGEVPTVDPKGGGLIDKLF